MTTFARELADSLRSGGAAGPGAPRLTWYGPDGERVELSGKVLDNWVAKTANFLQEELDGSPGMSLAIDMPSHWKSLVLSFGAMVLGLELDLDAGADDEPDLLATSNAATVARADSLQTQLLTVALPALSLSWPDPLPRSVVDYTSGLRSHGDVFTPWDSPAAGQVVLRSAAQEYDDAALPAFVDALAVDAQRVLLSSAEPLAQVLAQALGIWKQDGSVVLVHPEVKITETLLASERITRQ